MADSNKNKGAGLSAVAGGAIGAGISAAGNIIGGLIDQAFAERNARIQRENQEKLMDYQNNLQVEQWNRENAYNDPSAVRARFEKAGIAPQAIFGSGTTAGIAGGLSSAPSGGAQSVSPGNSFGGLGSDMAQGMNAVTTAKRIDAENELVEQKAKKAKWENDVLNPILADLNTALKDEKVADATIKQIDATFRAALNKLEVDTRTASLAEIIERTRSITQEIESSKAFQALKEEEKKLVTQNIFESEARIVRMAIQNDLDTYTAKSEVMLNKSQTILNLVKRDNLRKAIEVMDSEISLIASKVGLNEEQVAELKRRFTLDEDRNKHLKSLETAEEVRKYIKTFIFDNIPSVTIGASVGRSGGSSSK